MAETAFDIYQTDAGYAAVANPVQRTILDALRAGEKQLPELVDITGRSKPTLSSLHMKELLAREIIEEKPHPTDSRRKVYRLKATKIGSSDIPVAQLRDAVQQYVALGPLKSRLPLRAVIEALLAAPAGTEPKVLWAQARHLGSLAGADLKVGAPRELWMRIGSLLEQEELARTLRIDLEKGVLELAPAGPLAKGGAWAAAILGGLVEGVAAGKGLPIAGFKAVPVAGAVRIQAS